MQLCFMVFMILNAGYTPNKFDHIVDLIDTDPFIWPVHTLSARPKAYRGDPACPDPAIIIRDPIIPDHLDWMLQDLFIQGFEPQQLG